MTSIILAFDRELLIAEKNEHTWNIRSFFKGANPISLAFDPHHHILYCATFDRGLWKTCDNGSSWEAIDLAPSFGEFVNPKDVSRKAYTALQVSIHTKNESCSTLYAGTEPSSIVSSTDGGHTFKTLTDFSEVSSKANWFFPQRPHTHHVKHIEIHPNYPDILYATIEVGGLFYSMDRGLTWTEAVNAPRDIHQLSTHPKAPERLYGALGDSFLKEHNLGHGYAESLDNGLTWKYITDGLEHHYAYHLVVDPQDPNNILLAASSNPRNAHEYQEGHCESFIYRKQKNKPWQHITEGLPESKGTLISVLSVNAKGHFYAFNNKGVYVSLDRGQTWSNTEIPWNPRYTQQHPYAMVIID